MARPATAVTPFCGLTIVKLWGLQRFIYFGLYDNIFIFIQYNLAGKKEKTVIEREAYKDTFMVYRIRRKSGDKQSYTTKLQ